MRPRHGAAAGGARRGRGRGARAGGRAGRRRVPARAAPAAPGQRLREDLRRLRPALLVLRDPAHQGRLRDRRGRGGAALRPGGAGRRRPRARARRPGHVALGAAGMGRGEPPARRAGGARARPATGCAFSTCSRKASTTSFLEALAAHAVPYVDVPLQHASGAVLRRMRRSGDGAAHLALLERVRAVAARRRRPLHVHHRVPRRDGRRVRGARRLRARGATSPSPASSSTTSRRGRPPPACRTPCRTSSPSNAPPASARSSTARLHASGRARRPRRSTSSSSKASSRPDGVADRPHRPAGARRRRPHRRCPACAAGAATSCAPSSVTASGMMWRPSP